MSFTGFSEEDLKRVKSIDTNTGTNNGSRRSVPEPWLVEEISPGTYTPHASYSANINLDTSIKKLNKIGEKPKRPHKPYKLSILQTQNSDDAIDSIDFDKCKLSLRNTISPDIQDVSNKVPSDTGNEDITAMADEHHNDKNDLDSNSNRNTSNLIDMAVNNNRESIIDISFTEKITDVRKYSVGNTPDVVRNISNYTEDELAAHKKKLEDLQLKQKLMEEQNKKRKEMLAKALADRTKQTEEEVLRLEKIKKELQVLDGQFSQDVAVLRKKIDQACSTYADAEKNYLRVEKEFLQAKINLQKEKEKKELLTEHLCALITHNETRKAQKLETLMLELATDKKTDISDSTPTLDSEKPVIEDNAQLNIGNVSDSVTGKVTETQEH